MAAWVSPNQRAFLFVEDKLNYVEKLVEFHKGAGDKFPVDYIPGDYYSILRKRLINEETQELEQELEGVNFADKSTLLKELCDVLYVVFGTAVTYGLPIDKAFERVHENNMLKTAYDRNLFGKIIKPPHHPKVDLKDLV